MIRALKLGMGICCAAWALAVCAAPDPVYERRPFLEDYVDADTGVRLPPRIGNYRKNEVVKNFNPMIGTVIRYADPQGNCADVYIYSLDTSNLETWDATPIENEQLDLLYQRMNSMIHRVKPERTDLDMIYEIMLKLGVPLTYSVTPFSINNKTVYGVGDDCLLLVCLAENVQPEDVEQMTEYAPAKIIISRDSFPDDTAMANAYYILRDHGIELKLV